MDMWKILALSCVVAASARGSGGSTEKPFSSETPKESGPTQKLEEMEKNGARPLANDNDISNVVNMAQITEQTEDSFESVPTLSGIKTEGEYTKERGGSDPLYNGKHRADFSPSPPKPRAGSAPTKPFTPKRGQDVARNIADKPIKQGDSDQISSKDQSCKSNEESGAEDSMPRGGGPLGNVVDVDPVPDWQKTCKFCDTVTALRIWNVIAEGGSVSEELERALCSTLYTSYDMEDTRRAASALLYAAWREGRTVAPYTWALLQLCYTEVVAAEQSQTAQKDAARGLLQQITQPDNSIKEMLDRLEEC